MRMKRLFKFDYPKLGLLVLFTIAAYFIFKRPEVGFYLDKLGALSYIGIFIGGMLFAFGFSAPFAVGFFIALNPDSIYLAALIAGVGALVSDLLIFNFIRFSFMDEFQRLSDSKIVRSVNRAIDRSFLKKLKVYVMYVFAGILIASPMPDEAGVVMLAGLTEIKQFWLGFVGFVLNTIGIFLILNI